MEFDVVYSSVNILRNMNLNWSVFAHVRLLLYLDVKINIISINVSNKTADLNNE
jgi:hypothetical protein